MLSVSVDTVASGWDPTYRSFESYKGNTVEPDCALQDFVIEVHKTAAERKDTMSQRAQIMLELVVDIKNNRKAKSSTSENTLESFLSQGSLRWLKESKVEDVQLRGVTWERLLDPNKKASFKFIL